MNLSFIFEFRSEFLKMISPYKIKFTSSVNNQTSTLIISFYTPIWLLNSKNIIEANQPIKLLLIVENEFQFSTVDIKFIWVKGKPILLQAVFLITSELESIRLKQIFTNLRNAK